jgi:AcrR family transcriptional regulator
MADAAGVSKGAVQHHFGTREQIFIALGELYVTEFNDALAREDVSAIPAMQYASLSLKTSSDEDVKGWRAMLVAAVADRGIAERWSKLMENERSRDKLPSPNALLIRLAADGLWLSDLLRIYKISEEEREQLSVLMSDLLKDS